MSAENISNSQQLRLEPLPYQVELREYLRSRERVVWDWFASAQARADYRDNLRLELLKTTYRLDPDGHADLYTVVDEAKVRLGLDIPVTLYQSQNNLQSNAALFFIEGEGHIVFSGAVLSLLDGHETKSVIAHELAHYYLWSMESGEYQIVDRIVQAAALDHRGVPSHVQSARWYGLYTEIFADRGSLHATGDVHPVVGGLVKIDTGLANVSAAGYLKQAEEVFATGGISSEGLSHPETFIRARALTLWRDHGDGANAEICRMIEGDYALDELDIVGQLRLTDTTRRLLMVLLCPKWFQTPPVMDHARRFFDDFRPATSRDQTSLDDLRFTDPKLREYLCYVLLDFVTADPDLDELPLVAALQIADELEIASPFEKLIVSELKVKARDIKRLREQANAILAKGEAQIV